MKKKVLLILIFIILIALVIVGRRFFLSKEKGEIIKTDEFSFTLGNDQLDKAIQDYLLSQEYFSWKTTEISRNFCVFEKLDQENELFPLYLWVRCGEFIKEGDKLKEQSGMSGPVKIDYPNELSFYNPERFFHIVPRDGSLYAEDIKTIFPQNLQKRISNFDSVIINERIKNVAQDNF